MFVKGKLKRSQNNELMMIDLLTIPSMKEIAVPLTNYSQMFFFPPFFYLSIVVFGIEHHQQRQQH
ncbi:CLUMA_CG008519, isoform D [Clunio marinus]|uniref:CLUMA_CG008519, isoform D n=1 Tax=Clunio marinus TaxID=568069 RepID=A0A1J1I9C6_9DIPT|nr:CLUMA_CG008519, isoform D [Clunio marinus]